MTRPEWLLLTGCLVIAVTAATTIREVVIHRRLYAAVRADLAEIERAATAFFHEYGIWPSEATSQRTDTRYGRDGRNSPVFNILRAIDGPGNPAHQLNIYRIVFLEARAYKPGRSGINQEGHFLDPWGTPYQIALDANLDGHTDIERSIYGTLSDRPIAVWSAGPDGLSDTGDDLLGWKP